MYRVTEFFNTNYYSHRGIKNWWPRGEPKQIIVIKYRFIVFKMTAQITNSKPRKKKVKSCNGAKKYPKN